ncbi:MAG: threonine synthase [Treponema sp.]|jgi:threonine synthase|nr:threonine synthase [Treponema sp.]
MQFRSTNSNCPLVSYKEAALHCLPPDGGLYVPDQSADIRQFFLHMDEKTSFNELVGTVAPSLLEGDINPVSALRIARNAYNFEPQLTRLDASFSLLNLYSGPTGIFKDYGLAFLSAALEELTKNSEKFVILCAARGDTGASTAHTFSGRKGISLVLLYPSGQIRGLDKSTFVQNGGNIIPIQIRGTLDDCQRLVIEAINDRKFSGRYNITSANTINSGRLLPQIFYYLYAFTQIKNKLHGDLMFSVPCGNFGDLIAGLYAWKFGMPVNGFIAAMNSNNAFGDFIVGKPFVPRPVINTNTPSLDISVPTNYRRLASFYDEAPAVMRNMVYPESVDNNLTLKTMEDTWRNYKVHIDPNTAVALAAAQRINTSRKWKGQTHIIVLATGHPAREANLARKACGGDIEIPECLLALRKKSDPAAVIKPKLEAFEGAVAGCF